MHIALAPIILAPIGIIFTILATCFIFRVFWGTLRRWCRVIPESTSFIKRLWHDPFVYMLVSMMGVLLFFATPLIIISHSIPMKNFDEHVTVQGHNVTIENLPKAYSLCTKSGDSIGRISGEYRDGKLIVDGAEYELSKSDIKYLDRKVKDNESN